MSKNINTKPWPPFKRSGTTITPRTTGDAFETSGDVALSGKLENNGSGHIVLTSNSQLGSGFEMNATSTGGKRISLYSTGVNAGVGAGGIAILNVTDGTYIMNINASRQMFINTTDFDGTPPIGFLTVKSATNDGTDNIFVGRDSDEVNVFSVNSDGDIIANSFTDGTATLTGGALSGVTTIGHSGVLTSSAAHNITIADTINDVGLTVTNNDTTNNPDSCQITNTTTGADTNINGLLIRKSSESVADDGYIDLPDATTGWGTVFIDKDLKADFSWDVDGTVLIDRFDGAVVGTDTDTNLCVFDNGTTVRIRNRLGSTQTIKLVIYY